MNRLNPYLKAVVSLIGPAYAATTLAVQQHHGQNWTIVGAAALSSFLVWLVPNLPKLEKEITLPQGRLPIKSRGYNINAARAAAGLKPPPSSVIHVEGDPSKQPTIIKFEGGVELTEADIERLNAVLKGPHVRPAEPPSAPAVQPPATGTGAAQ